MRWLVLAVILAIAGGCGPSADERPNLGISNGTALSITLLVNGTIVGVYRGGSGETVIDESRLSQLPWDVEGRTSTGRIVTFVRVDPGGVSMPSEAGSPAQHGALARVDLSCGRLSIWVGNVVPSGPMPDPSAGVPGDCEP